MENLLKQIEELSELALHTQGLLNLDQQRSRLNTLKLKLNDPGFWNNREQAVNITREIENTETAIGKWDDLNKEIKDLEDLVALGNKENDSSIETEAKQKLDELSKKYEQLEFYVLFAGDYDQGNAFLSIHAGTGGVDAQDWAQMLERMFLRFAEKMNWRVEIIDRTIGNEAGIKSMMIKISGSWAYGYLKSESGVHRLVRISPFDAEAMRHTSFALVEVIPDLPETADVELKDQDVRIDVFRSSGPGGQSVNTTDSAVRIVHIPTNITVTCQTERSQHQNKENAFKILKAKLFVIAEEERRNEELKLRGEAQKAEWGKQIRSYVLQPYKMVKDHRTDYETQDVDSVLDGELVPFVEAYLRQKVKIENK